jgi:hypothetical protein
LWASASKEEKAKPHSVHHDAAPRDTFQVHRISEEQKKAEKEPKGNGSEK